MLSLIGNILVPALTVLLLGRGIWVLVNLAIAHAAARRAIDADPPRPGVDAPRLVILLPMLREQAIAAATVNRFARLPYGDGSAVICVITTEREEVTKAELRTQLEALSVDASDERELARYFHPSRLQEVVAEIQLVPAHQRVAKALELYDREPTTSEIVAGVVGKPDSAANGRSALLPVAHLHQPPVPGHASSQLNFALANMDSIASAAGWTSVDEDDVYVMTFDADSIPDARTLPAIAELVRGDQAAGRPAPGLIQQQRLPLLLGRPFPPGLRGALLAADWIYQTRRCLAIELIRVLQHRWVTTSRLPRLPRALLRPFVYSVGCGMTARLSTLRGIGGYQQPFADIGSGYRICLLGESIAPLRLFAVDETYSDFRSVVNLQSLAYISTRYPGQHSREMGSASRLRLWERMILVARGRLDLMLWALSGPIFAAGLLLAVIIASSWLPLLLVAIVLWGPVTAATILLMRTTLWRSVAVQEPVDPRRRRATTASVIAAIVLSPLAQLIETSGPWRVHATGLMGRAVKTGKTER